MGFETLGKYVNLSIPCFCFENFVWKLKGCSFMIWLQFWIVFSCSLIDLKQSINFLFLLCPSF